MKRNLDFLYEIGCLRYIDRAWKQLVQTDVANLAEHTLRVAWTAMIIAKREGVTDLGHLTKLALVHDLGESRTGDAHYVSSVYVKRDEELGVKDIFAGTELEQEFLALWKEVDAKESLEAKCVKDADTLDVDLEIREMWAKGMKAGDPAYWAAHRKEAVRNRLYTKTGQEIWDAIQDSNPLDWHLHTRNRFTDGPWKKI